MNLLTALHRLQHQRGWLSPESLRELAERLVVPLHRLEGLVSFYPHLRTEPSARVEVAVCRDAACRLAAAGDPGRRLRQQVQSLDGVRVREVSCLGHCDCAPAAMINERLVNTSDERRMAEWLRDPETLPQAGNGPGQCLLCDPYRSPEQYYGEFRRALDRTGKGPSAIDEILKQSGLRGMGGAGFSTGLKWELVRKEAGRPKYVVCNCDESEPGTFKDRMILAEVPHLVIEGMMLAGLHIGAEKGILFVRNEYQPELAAAERTIQDARRRGLLGPNILGSGIDFQIEVAVSMGGYILGEETALLECLEDRRGEPRNKPPFPGSKGLWGRPTLINNVETLAFVPVILHHGPQWWKRQGRGPSVGLKFIAVSGQVERPGVFLVPMGTPVSELIAMAGGVKAGQALKAFAPGGASSKFLPAEMADLPMDFEPLQQAGSMLGTGALLVVAEGTDLLDLARNLVQFFRNESCGKCVPCRQGSEKAVGILEALLAGRGRPEHLELLRQLHETLAQTSICGLGQAALNPILSVMEHFPEDVRPSGK